MDFQGRGGARGAASPGATVRRAQRPGNLSIISIEHEFANHFNYDTLLMECYATHLGEK